MTVVIDIHAIWFQQTDFGLNYLLFLLGKKKREIYLQQIVELKCPFWMLCQKFTLNFPFCCVGTGNLEVPFWNHSSVYQFLTWLQEQENDISLVSVLLRRTRFMYADSVFYLAGSTVWIPTARFNTCPIQGQQTTASQESENSHLPLHNFVKKWGGSLPQQSTEESDKKGCVLGLVLGRPSYLRRWNSLLQVESHPWMINIGSTVLGNRVK